MAHPLDAIGNPFSFLQNTRSLFRQSRDRRLTMVGCLRAYKGSRETNDQAILHEVRGSKKTQLVCDEHSQAGRPTSALSRESLSAETLPVPTFAPGCL